VSPEEILANFQNAERDYLEKREAFTKARKEYEMAEAFYKYWKSIKDET